MQALRKAMIYMPALLACGAFSSPTHAQPPPEASANTVLGPNAMLADGAAALMNGQWERGIQLTQMGLSGVASTADRAAGLANLCAGYVATKKYERALENCDQSLQLDAKNWRAWQNRAAANLALGKIDDSLRDIQRGLAINPESRELQKTLAIVRAREKLQQDRLDTLLES